MKVKHIAPLLKGEVCVYTVRGYNEEYLYRGKPSMLKPLYEKQIMRIHADKWDKGVVFIQVK